MANCPRCHQLIDNQALKCPYCRTLLKAYGHPGIPLHQATDVYFLCDRCIYDEDDTCNYPQRPYAKTCTLFHDKSKPLLGDVKHFCYNNTPWQIATAWCRRNRGLLILFALIVFSLAIALN
jgi:Double zinc ribbon